MRRGHVGGVGQRQQFVHEGAGTGGLQRVVERVEDLGDSPVAAAASATLLICACMRFDHSAALPVAPVAVPMVVDVGVDALQRRRD